MCETLNKEELEKKQSPKSNLLQKIGFDTKEPEPLTAEKAWCESMYGESTYKTIENRILDKQSDIRRIIKSKFAPRPQDNVVRYASFHCVVDIEEDLLNYVDEVFKPFTENGFEVINLSKECKSIDSEGVYFISWKKAFKKS